MRILKVELQNINSLKSNTAIVIDFESEQFKDVGLYAITGATGAGKTTILDAITIALYHNVPRFNGTKGTLLNVVSHGAHGAFSRVTFENDHIIYEAFWGIRVADKKGKPYKNAKEEVSLKNLTTNSILATQKRNLIAEIIRVTQLDYNQFLRSVMLAQGEFASFLSAKGPEKGRLLEQITGEQIYKKIGQGILDRKSNEENKLKEIQAKINSEDVLTEEKKIELTQKDKELDAQITASEKEIKSIETIVNWYIKFNELTCQTEKIQREEKEVNADIENYKEEFKLLDLNEKATPFKELIQNFNRNEKSRIEKSNQLKLIEEQLTVLKPQIERLEIKLKKETVEVVASEKRFTDWLPKFDAITKIDGDLKNEVENNRKLKAKLKELKQQISDLEDDKRKLVKELNDTVSKVEINETFVSKNKFLKEVAVEISDWATGLTTLKSHKETLKSNSLLVRQKKETVLKTNGLLKLNNELLLQKIAKAQKAEKEIKALTKQLDKNNISDLLAKKETILTTESNWKQFKNLAEQHRKFEVAKTTLIQSKKSFSTNLEEIKKQLSAVKKELETQEKAVVDASKILDLEKSVAKYEDDRKHLINGEPCGLCGSKVHPFTENGITINVSKSELELNNRKELLQSLIDTKTTLDKAEVQLTTKIDSLSKQLNDVIVELKTIESSSKKLNISCELTNFSRINIELNLLTEQLKKVNGNIRISQQLQADKDKFSKEFEEQNKAVGLLKTKVATLNEKNSNVILEIQQHQNIIDTLSKTYIDLENDFKTKLSKFNYQLPTAEQTNLFLKEIESEIKNFNKIEKNLDTLKTAAKIFETKLDNQKKQLENLLKSETEFIKLISDSDLKYEQLKTQRTVILPMEISVESKRNDLQKLSKQLVEKVEFTKNEIQNLLDAKNKQETLKVNNIANQKELKEELEALNLLLKVKLTNSGFSSKEAVEKALLSVNDVLKFTENKERIKEKQLKIKTLKEVTIKAIENLNKTKNFEISEAQSKLELADLNKKRKAFISEKGEIIQAFKKDQEIRDRNAEVYKKIEKQTEICNVWKELFKIIGNSKEAFNVYVQRLTLKHLLDLANVHLYKLNKRYSLKIENYYKPKEELNFLLIDHYQTNQARLIDTSSGGEKFIISLALALGLSDLASKNVKIDSLFIDEGFGTLDNNTLETVISTLETLQSQGKLIGIISHVENLKDRITTQIQIAKKSNGVSKVNIL